MAQPNLDLSGAAERRFDAYLDAIAGALGHADRTGPARASCTGLLLPGARQSIEPLAARLAPQRVRAAHQSLHHLVAQAAWRDEAVLQVVREQVLPAIERHGPIRHRIIDDTGFPRKGRHSVGVARQYCGQLGKQESCQVAVTLAVANDHAGLPIAHRLYLPEVWAGDPARRAKVGVPEEVAFRTKPRIALGQTRQALADGVPTGVVLADAGYGIETDFRTRLTELGLPHVVGVQSSTGLWPPGGTGPLPPKPWSGRGRPPRRVRRGAGHKPIAAAELAEGLPAAAWRTVARREGSRAELASRFAAVRARPAHRDDQPPEARPEEWLLIEWPAGESGPTKYWLSTLPAAIGLKELVATAKARRRIERDFQELEREIGLGHDEGRGRRGVLITTPACASPRTASSWPSGVVSPLSGGSTVTSSRRPPDPPVSGRAARVAPVRPERHVASSIASLRRRLTAGLVRRPPRCPCCLAPPVASDPLMTL
jgi:SRSO17 transposase